MRNATPADDLVSTLNVSEDDLKWQSWLDSKVGEPYDKFAIFLIIVDRPLPSWLHIDEARQGCWWCSHLSAVVAGLEDNNEPITPQELYKRLAEKG